MWQTMVIKYLRFCITKIRFLLLCVFSSEQILSCFWFSFVFARFLWVFSFDVLVSWLSIEVYCSDEVIWHSDWVKTNHINYWKLLFVLWEELDRWPERWIPSFTSDSTLVSRTKHQMLGCLYSVACNHPTAQHRHWWSWHNDMTTLLWLCGGKNLPKNLYCPVFDLSCDWTILSLFVCHFHVDMIFHRNNIAGRNKWYPWCDDDDDDNNIHFNGSGLIYYYFIWMFVLTNQQMREGIKSDHIHSKLWVWYFQASIFSFSVRSRFVCPTNGGCCVIHLCVCVCTREEMCWIEFSCK